MWTMEAGDHAAFFEADSGAAALDDPAAAGNQQAFDIIPFDPCRHRIVKTDSSIFRCLLFIVALWRLLAIFASAVK
jgi:hypothetical protein